MKVLILGGTSEAVQLGRKLDGDPRFTAMISLAGRTRQPAPQLLPARIGGFGGVHGLADYLAAERVEALIDATHPFAVRISRNAADACAAAAVPMLAIRRPEWRPAAGDRWIIVAGMDEAARALGEAPRRVMLTVGRTDLASFGTVPQHHFLIRSVDAPPRETLPPRAEIMTARGPFVETEERELLMARGIEVLVTKNSGGGATAAKLLAARALRLPVVMVARPPAPAAEAVSTAEEALAWLAGRHALSSARGA